MDILLRNKKKFFCFSIDEICLKNIMKKLFSIRIIPDINSQYFPPHHLRMVNIRMELLTKNFYLSMKQKILD